MLSFGANFHSERERIEDEQGIEKLYKDVTTGNLRRKRGADYDLSDSDDGGEARRRMKRRQFAKMQKALYADERVKKMAKNPGNQAFLRAMQDQESDDEMNLLDMGEPAEEEQTSTATPPHNDEDQTVPDSQPRKALGDAAENHRAPAHLRRTKDGKKPAHIGEVRQTLSSLLEERESSIIPATQAGSDSERDDEEGDEVIRPSSFRSDKENDAPNPRRGRVAVVDRISLKRNNSSNVSASRLAFATNGPTSSAIKIPAFLRRASSAASSSLGSVATATTSSTTPGAAGGFVDEGKIKKPTGARGRSGIHGFGSARTGAGMAAESEAMAKVRESERRRQEKRARGAERRMGAVGGLLGKGSFE
jgi:mediator of replication checkpoint protein 1